MKTLCISRCSCVVLGNDPYHYSTCWLRSVLLCPSAPSLISVLANMSQAQHDSVLTTVCMLFVGDCLYVAASCLRSGMTSWSSCSHMCDYVYARIYIRTYIRMCMHACIHMYIHTHIHTYIRMYKCTHVTYIHAYIRMYMHALYVRMYIRMYVHTYISCVDI